MNCSIQEISSQLPKQLIQQPDALNTAMPVTGFSIDSRTLEAGNVFFAISGEHFDGHHFIQQAVDRGMSYTICERYQDSVPADRQLLVADTKQALTTVAQWYASQFPIEHLWIVNGSNGKTTTKNILHHLMQSQIPTLATKGNFNNDIGVPLTLFRLREEHRALVLEIGANAEGEILTLSRLVHPSGVIVTNAKPAHLEGFKTLGGVRKAKGEALLDLQSGQFAVLNRDDEAFEPWCEMASPAEVISVGCSTNADVVIESYQSVGGLTQFKLLSPWWQQTFTTKLYGKFNVRNAAQAIVAAYKAGISTSDIARALATFEPTPGRFNVQELNRDLIVVDDTYNANPSSVKEAILTLKQMASGQSSHARMALLLGDLKELGDDEVALHQEVGQFARKQGVDWLGAVGNLASHCVDGFDEPKQGVKAENKKQLVDALISTIQFGAISTVKESKRNRWFVLVKGSRTSQMESCIDLIKEQLSIQSF